MRIGLTCNTIDPVLTQGKIDGIGVYTKNLMNELVKLKHAVIPYSFPTMKKYGRKSYFSEGEILPLPYNIATICSLSNFLTNKIYQSVETTKIDLLHVTDHMVPRFQKTPVLATIHDALMFSHPEWYPSKSRSIKNYLRKKTFCWVDHFITISQAMIPELVRYLDIPEKKISVVYNGISPEWFLKIDVEKKKTILKKLNLPSQFILFTGTLQPKKNLPRLIEAFLSLPKEIQKEFPLVIVGKSGWGAQESLSAIKKLTENQAGYWLNYISEEELRVLYQSAKLYAFPSLHEGFGLTLLEAFASHAPVLTSNVSALPEIAGEAAYLIDPHSVIDIKNGLQTLLTSPSLCDELIQKGYHRVQSFTLEQCALNTINIYEKMLSTSM